MRDILGVTWRLLVIMIVAGLCLGLTNAVTKTPIREQELMTAQTLRRAVLPQADSFQDLSIQENGISAVYEGVSGGSSVGYVFEMSGTGFGGEIKLTVGIADGTLTGVRIAAHSETPGLGANADSDSFLSQYEGKSGRLSVIKAGTPADSEILAVTASTRTSAAVTEAINEAIAYYESNLG